MQTNTVVQLLALGLLVGSLFFGALGVNAKQDFFLVMGNVSCIAGNLVFAAMVYEEHSTWATTFVCAAVFCVYGIVRQVDKFRRHGFGDDDDEEEGGSGSDSDSDSDSDSGEDDGNKPLRRPLPASASSSDRRRALRDRERSTSRPRSERAR